MHENAYRTTIDKAISHYEKNEPKGEFVLVIEGRSFEELEQEEISKLEEISIYDHYLKIVESGIDGKEAMKIVAKERGISKRDVYAEVLEHKE